MGDDKTNTSQLRFENGRLVDRSETTSTTDADHTADPVTPGEQTGFTVEVKSGALDVNSELRDVIKTHSHTLEFGSRTAAEDYAEQLSASDGSLRIQSVPDNEPKAIDAYLLADHNPSIKTPAEIEGNTWTFDVGANLYGALGEAILIDAPKPHALIHYIRQDLDFNEADLESGLNVTVERGQLLSVTSSEETKRWTPDCIVGAKDGWNGELLERYYCEIKTGNASFERSQVEAMKELATDERVLKIRVSIDELPEQYSLRINEVSPEA